jgi:branched-chain amino acid transport system ATP-binding protein
MAEKDIHGQHMTPTGTVSSVEEIVSQEEALIHETPSLHSLDTLAGANPILTINQLTAGYHKMEILHDFNLRVGLGQSLCLIGPNGAGKSTVLHSIFGFTNIMQGQILVQGKDITHDSPQDKLQQHGIAYLLQDNSIFPKMTVEENLWMGGYLLHTHKEAKERADIILDKYAALKGKRHVLAGVLSGGECRLLEISRALIMNPKILLIDEPSIGLEPKYIDLVFDILTDLKVSENKSIIMVEQNAKKGLSFADVGYVLISGHLALVGTGEALLENPKVGRLFLGD